MIEERALVIKANEGYAWVETQRRTSCDACSANQGCGAATLARILGRRRTRLRVLTRLPLQAGDQVIIGIEENALIRGSLAVYMVPLMMLLLGASMGASTASGEGMTILLGLLGLGGGFAWLRSFTCKIQADTWFQPLVLRRLNSQSRLAA